MASDVEIRVKTTGAAKAAEELDEVSDSVHRVGRASTDETGKLDKLGEAGGNVETRFLGLGAGISGVSTLMSGDAGPEDYAMAIADLGDSIEHTVIPALKNLSMATLTNIANTVKAGVTHVVTAAQVVASWVLMGIQATINAVKMAAAWLISLGPIGLVIAAIAAVIAILVALGVSFDDVKRWAGTAWNAIKDGVTAAKDWVGGRIGDIVGFVTGLPGKIAEAAAGMWNALQTGLGVVIANISRQLNRLIEAFNRLSPVNITPIGIPGRQVSRTVRPTGGPVRAMAHGGIATGFTMVGEHGRELIDLGAAGARVRSNPDTEALLAAGAGAGGPTINVYVAGSVMSERDLIQVIRDEAYRGGFRGAFE